jgi:hypothetical protein
VWKRLGFAEPPEAGRSESDVIRGAIDIVGRVNGHNYSELRGFQSFQVSVTFVALYAVERKDFKV